ncbi:phosphate ABC transporter substrate-binding protein [Brumicola blandensis]|jgi:ABC-type phosphate transport system substrate-binding protein|uniref:Phosphate ABC transporter substrate-binding protein n=1 Tax=Brumicola blandensis TaxID=3075611 RepID=A0AAW8R168_9ALTE|nr:phosphate ABC transporter substrate-binding protein [Alteromonas sp. W409]MDT0582774.1 phosphate ABC transporter substrate-binding protein [Alteromonas sp. W409]
MKRIIGTFIFGALFSSQVFAGYAVVVHPENTSEIDYQLVKRIFLGKETAFSNGEVATVLTHSPDSALRVEFDEAVLQRRTAAVDAYWSKLVFTGRGTMPKTVSSDQEMIELILQNKNAIGFIDTSSVNSDVKVVKID